MLLVTVNSADRGMAHSNWSKLIRPLDEGDFDVRSVLKQLADLHYLGPVGLQAYGVNLPPKENLERSMAAWRHLNASGLEK